MSFYVVVGILLGHVCNSKERCVGIFHGGFTTCGGDVLKMFIQLDTAMMNY